MKLDSLSQVDAKPPTMAVTEPVKPALHVHDGAVPAELDGHTTAVWSACEKGHESEAQRQRRPERERERERDSERDH